MNTEPTALDVYGNRQIAERYHRRKGFAPERKDVMLEVVLDLLVALSPPGSTLLELGAGSGLFTLKIVEANHFSRIHVTDGAPAMLDIARRTLPDPDGALQYALIDFTTPWSEGYALEAFDAVTSTMAVHHAEDKRQLFGQVFALLVPGGVFVLGDHVAGASPGTHYLIGRERAWVRLGREQTVKPKQLEEMIQWDERRQEAEGNRCESVARYEAYLSVCGFVDVECLWRDYWLAVFVARKPGE